MIYRRQIATELQTKIENIDVLIPWEGGWSFGGFDILQFSVTREPQQREKQY